MTNKNSKPKLANSTKSQIIKMRINNKYLNKDLQEELIK